MSSSSVSSVLLGVVKLLKNEGGNSAYTLPLMGMVYMTSAEQKGQRIQSVLHKFKWQANLTFTSVLVTTGINFYFFITSTCYIGSPLGSQKV